MIQILSALLEHAKDTEWQTRHAAENTYCPYCATSEDAWRDQTEHHPGCQYVAMVASAQRLLDDLKAIREGRKPS